MSNPPVTIDYDGSAPAATIAARHAGIAAEGLLPHAHRPVLLVPGA